MKQKKERQKNIPYLLRLREMCYRKLYLTFCYTRVWYQYTLYLKVT